MNSEKKISAEHLSALVVWAQAMPPLSTTISSISKPDDDNVKQQPNELVVADDSNALKKQVASLNAQVKELVAVVDGLRESVEHLEWEHSPVGKKRRDSTENNQLSQRSSQLPAYINALKSLQDLSGHELQQVLKNYNLEWSRVGSDQMRLDILKHSGFGHFLVDQKTCDNT